MPKSVGFCNVFFLDKVICRFSSFTFQNFIKHIYICVCIDSLMYNCLYVYMYVYMLTEIS